MKNNINPQNVGADPVPFLQLASQGTSLATHADLWRWLQGDVQAWLPHDAMLVGWGDFGAGELEFDIVSSVPGLRTHHCAPASMAPLLGYLRDCWVAARQLPCQVQLAGCQELLRHCNRASAAAIGGMRSALVHGTADRTGGGERIFAALSVESPQARGNAMALLLPYIDIALRRMPARPFLHLACDGEEVHARRIKSTILSEREREIMEWVALGKTNPEIGCILNISEFTVKNHMKSVFTKLDVTNRAQAVAKLARMTAHA